MPTSISAASTSISAAAPAGEKTLVLRVPADLAAWASAQARREGSDLSKRIRAFLRQWQAEVQAAEVEAAAQRQAEIEAAVAKALKTQARKRKPAATRPPRRVAGDAAK